MLTFITAGRLLQTEECFQFSYLQPDWMDVKKKKPNKKRC